MTTAPIAVAGPAPAAPSSPMTPAAPAGLLVIAAAAALPSAGVYMTQPLFPEIAGALGVGATEARLAFTATGVAYGLAFFAFGPLADRYPGRGLAVAGALGQAVFALAMALAGGFTAFLCFAAAFGVAAAAVPAAVFALVARTAPPGRTGLHLGIAIGAAVAGMILGRWAPGVAAEAVGWRTTFLGAAALFALLAAALRLLPGNDPRLTTHLTTLPRQGLRRTYGAALGLLARRRVAWLLATGFALFAGYLGPTSMLTYHLAGPPFGAGTGEVGWISLAGLTAVLGAPLSGRLLPVLGARPVMLAGLALMLAAQAVLLVAGTLAAVATGVALLFLGVFVCQPVVFALLAEAVPADRRGTATSFYFLVCILSGGLSTAALGPVWEAAAWPGVSAASTAGIAAAGWLLLRATGPAAVPAEKDPR
jgi:YNFM family putative membrane transporter